MRKIKFRGKTDKGEWIYGDLLQIAKEVYIAPTDGDWFDFLPWTENNIFHLPASKYIVDPETLGQFTGVLDKNGREIYEGDIVKTQYSNRAPVKYKEVNFHVEFGGYRALLTGEYEVVGNIYDKKQPQRK